MNKRFAILPCNGLDKAAGQVSREIALRLMEQTSSEIICPVFYRYADAKYNKLAGEMPLLVIDGCAHRCASKQAAEKKLTVAKKIVVSEEGKKQDIALGKSLRLGDEELRLADQLAAELIKEDEAPVLNEQVVVYPEKYEYEEYLKDKFIFRVPRDGFLFNGNDCWAYVVGNRARIGVTDYVQQVLSDILFFTPPEVGAMVEQFGEAGEIESGKAIFEIVSPVSGTVTAVNEKLLTAPELINENPYELGWIAELELKDLEEDKELLMDNKAYLEIMKKKVDEFHAK